MRDSIWVAICFIMYRAVANQFTNSVEVSEQEACYLVLKLALHWSSRVGIFIPTGPPGERVQLLKSMQDLAELNEKDPDR